VARELALLAQGGQRGHGEQLALRRVEARPREDAPVGVALDEGREVGVPGGEVGPDRAGALAVDALEQRSPALGPVGLGQHLVGARRAQAAAAREHAVGLDHARKAGEDVRLQQRLAPGAVGLAGRRLAAQALDLGPAAEHHRREQARQARLESWRGHRASVRRRRAALQRAPWRP
jgi:hypothetical protein